MPSPGASTTAVLSPPQGVTYGIFAAAFIEELAGVAHHTLPVETKQLLLPTSPASTLLILERVSLAMCGGLREYR
jgi:hypothetical protein